MICEPVERATILTVDDNPTNLQVVTEHLANAGFKTCVARNGESALRQAAFSKPDLILLDVIMPPGIDGFETCRLLKQQDALKNIPVIFLTALSDPVNKAKGIDVGGVDYITKPFEGAELLARVRTHLALHRYRQELERTNQELQQANEALLESRKKLELAAKTDPLTQLSNRREVLANLEREKIRLERSQKPFAIALCDIDDFKEFNDSYGHDCGDFILVSVAQLMRLSIRKQDILARWGGEEFLLVFPETDLRGGRVVCEKIRTVVANHPFPYKNHQLSARLTFGVSVFTDFASSVEESIKRADQALYRGKQQGKNCVVLEE